jgi:uncharacterized protein
MIKDRIINSLKKHFVLLPVVFLFGFIFSSLNPIFSQNLSFPKPENYVNDFANVISSSVETLLNQKLRDFEMETSNQIFIVSVNDYQGTYMEDYAVKLFEEWGIGQAGRDNGILLLFKPEAERGSRVRIEVGYGLEGAVTDSIAGRILDNYFMDSYFNNDYDTAVLNTVDQLIAATEGEYSGMMTEDNSDIFDISATLLFVFFFLWSILASTKSWWFGGVLGFILGLILGYNWLGIIGLFILPWPFLLLGLLIDFIASKMGVRSGGRGGYWSSGGGGFSGGGGGFSGGGGGSSGGGGASR